MLARRLLAKSAFKPTFANNYAIRSLATVTGSSGRQMPEIKKKGTAVSHDRATFTIRVSCEVINTSGLGGTNGYRMDQFSMAALLVLSRMPPARRSLPPPLSVIPNQ